MTDLQLQAEEAQRNFVFSIFSFELVVELAFMAAIFYGLFGYFGWYFLQFNGHFCILHYLLIYIACLVSNWFRIVR